MKDCGTAIQKAFYDALFENITYSGATVPVYDQVPPDDISAKSTGTIFYYVLLSDIQVNEIPGNKDRHMYDCAQLVEVICGFPGIGNKLANLDIVDQIHQLIVPAKADVLSLGSDFRNIKIDLESNLQFTEQDGNHIIVRSLIRYSLEIEEI